MPYFALFDDALSGRAKLYQNHVESCLFHHNELASLDDVLQAGWKKGLHAVLFADYEFGLPLMDISSARSGNLRLHWFATCTEIDAESWLANHSDGLEAGISTPPILCIRSRLSRAYPSKSTKPSAAAILIKSIHRTPAPANLRQSDSALPPFAPACPICRFVLSA